MENKDTSTDIDISLEKKTKKASKKESKERSEEKEKKLEIVRANREMKRKLREKNKKRKRGEEVSEDEDENEKSATKKEPSTKKAKKEEGIWVGNLAFYTKPEAIQAFFEDCGKVARMRCPKGNAPHMHNKGFAYVFFDDAEAVVKAVAKSEEKLDGRALLIKNAKDFERKDGGEPTNTPKSKAEAKKQKNPPCPTLFVGNLSFETTREELKVLFEWAGDIRKVRMATFEDSGKCKGFAYIDFQTVEEATKAIRAPDKHNLHNRKLRVEFGSEEAHMRSKPWLMRAKKRDENKDQEETTAPEAAATEDETKPAVEEPTPSERKTKRKSASTDDDKAKAKSSRPKKTRVKPGEALAQAQRQKPSAIAFEGKKIVFDNED